MARDTGTSKITFRIWEKLGAIYSSYLQGFEPILEHLAKLQADLGVKCTDGADVIIGKIFKLRTGFNTTVGLPALFIIYIITHRTEIAGGTPFLKSPFSDPAFALLAADRTDIGFGKIFKGRACRNTIVGLSP